MKNNNLLTDMPVPSAFFKLAILACAGIIQIGINVIVPNID